MKASELRIGNLIFLKNIEWQVIASDIMSIEEHAVNAGLARGIPLTEEWLTRFGFEYNHGAYRLNINKGSHLRMWLTVRIFSTSVEVYLLHKHGLTIKYVHQLQNLFFALTGEELVTQPLREP
jgi:hypothetical protein